MRITRIYLAGFKSFARPTEITFPDDPVAVVGPNGCGKSNVIDALRWVMGESSARFLRGQHLDDIIFAGSNERPAAEQAVVELTLDNQQKRISGPFSAYHEITIRRRLNRDGQSRYEVNNTRVRRRDVIDLFLGTGVGARSYSVIEQGQVNRIVDARPEQLRAYLEEAAGISLYRERRRETHNRIAHTRENLVRLQDIRHELEQQREKLAHQAQVAEQYRTLAATLRQQTRLLAWVAVAENEQARERIGAQIAESEQQHERIDTQRQQLKTRETALHREHERLRAQWQWFADEFEQQTRHCQQMDQEKAQLATRRAGVAAGFKHDQQTLERHNREQQQLATQLAQLEKQQPELSQAMRHADAELKAREETHARRQQELEQARAHHLDATEAQIRPQREKAACQAELKNLRQTRQQLAHNHIRSQLAAITQRLREQQEQKQAEQQQRKQTAQTLDALTAEIAQQQQKQQAQSEQTTQARAELEARQHHHQNLAAEHRALAKLHRQSTTEPSGSHPRLQDYLIEHRAVPTWIAHALDQALNARVLTGDEHQQLNPQALADQPGYFVRIDHPDELEARVREWGALFSENLTTALSQRDALEDGQRWVTTDGWQVSRNWVGRADTDRSAEQLAQRQRLHTLENEAAQARQQRQQAQSHYEQHRAAEQQHRERLKTLEHQQRQQQSRYTHSEHQLDKIQQAKQTLLEQRQTLEARLLQEQQQQEQLDNHIHEREAQQRTLEQQIHEAETQLHATRAAQKQSQHALDQAEQQTRAARKQRACSLHALEDQQRHKRALQERCQRLEQELTQAKQNLTNHRGTLTELDQQQTNLASRLAEQQQKTAEIKEQREHFAAQLHQLDQQRHQLRAELEAVEHNLGQAQAERNQLALQAERLQTQAEHRQQTLDEARDGAGDEATTDLPTREQTEQLLANPEQRQTLKTRQRQTRQALDQIQGVNLNAIADHQAVVARLTELDAQLEDVHTALAQLNDAIATMDEQTRSRFQETYKTVNARLSQRFAQLFGGGEAHLALDDKDVLDAGVLLMARPPGKKAAHLSLLSGGERALTAVALIFAIFELNPAPFCVLDEIDAPLDEANVGRFCAMVASMSEQVQFMYITHNKITMAHAAALIGVTMQEPGVSRIVSVDMQQALHFVES